MVNRLITYEKAQSEVKRLKEYIQLVDSFEVNNLDDWIIYNYALTNSIQKIVDKAAEEDVMNNGQPLENKYVSSVINGGTQSELHRILRLGYRQRIRKSRG